jgi:hypothetical protein
VLVKVDEAVIGSPLFHREARKGKRLLGRGGLEARQPGSQGEEEQEFEIIHRMSRVGQECPRRGVSVRALPERGQPIIPGERGHADYSP